MRKTEDSISLGLFMRINIKCNNSRGPLHRLKMVDLPYSKTCLKRPLKNKDKSWFSDQLSLYAGQKCCRMLPQSAVLSTFTKLPFVNKIFVLSFLSGRSRQVLLYLSMLWLSVIVAFPCFTHLLPLRTRYS